jgi:molybdate transport system ATP-binding protein
MEGRRTLSDKLPAKLLTVRMKHRVGTVSLDVEFALTKPWTVLFGPSGSGKTTVLRTIAGFVRPEEAVIMRGAEVLVDSKARISLPAYTRPVRSAGQTARLFPQMTVRENVAYGVGWDSKSEAARGLVDEVLKLFRLGVTTESLPRDLSGGEQQKVSVARAVASAVTTGGSDGALLLLDEPFAGLDMRVRDELAVELKEWLGERKTPVLSVTHDVSEAFLLGAEVIKLRDGRVVQQGPVGEVLHEERCRLIEHLGAVDQLPG